MTIIKDITKRGALALLAVLLLALTIAVVAKADAQPPLFAEDAPGWNCFTMGNGECGDTLTYVLDEHGAKGAVLPVANDGRVYVSWPDGTVTDAEAWQRYAAWETCMDYSDGSDHEVRECGASYQHEGDDFSLARRVTA